MISPQHLINTGICGLFCATLFSLAATKPVTRQVAIAQPVSVAQDYTLHIKTGKVQQGISTSQVNYRVHQTRTLEQRNQEARERRAQFELLFTHSPRTDLSREVAPSEIPQAEDPSAILNRARNAVHRGIVTGSDESNRR